MDLWQAGLTGAVAALLTQGLGWLRDRWTVNRKRKCDADYLALCLAVTLEEFVVKCRDRMWSDEAAISQGSYDLDYSLPKLAPYPDDSQSWRSLHAHKPKIVEDVLSFRNEITSAELTNRFSGTYEGNPVASQDETIIAGVNALNLAKEIRAVLKLKPAAIKHADQLEDAYGKIQQSRADWAKRNHLTEG
ncbi:MAG: hypothetical protein WCD42_08640 [Rhizomicrobium sp.]